MTTREANARIDTLDRLLAKPQHRQDPRLWQERLELLRVIDRANAPTRRTQEADR